MNSSTLLCRKQEGVDGPEFVGGISPYLRIIHTSLESNAINTRLSGPSYKCALGKGVSMFVEVCKLSLR